MGIDDSRPREIRILPGREQYVEEDFDAISKPLTWDRGERMVLIDTPSEGSRLKADDAACGASYMTTMAATILCVAEESVRTAASIFHDTELTPPFSQYNVMRPALEAAAKLNYLLAPDHARVRLGRLAGLFADEAHHQGAGGLDPSLNMRAAQRAEQAVMRMGGHQVKPQTVTKMLSNFRSSISSSTDGYLSTWRQCSALAHSSGWSMSDLTEQHTLGEAAAGSMSEVGRLQDRATVHRVLVTTIFALSDAHRIYCDSGLTAYPSYLPTGTRVTAA